MSKNKKPHVFAAVDLGSNSFHMIVSRYENGELQTIERVREMVRLAAGMTERGKIAPEVSERALDCIRRFGKLTRDMHADVVRAVGTNALRRATNAGDFLKSAQKILGHPIEVISGEEEARLVYIGATHSISDLDGQRLVVDIGGGSTELILGEHFEPGRLHSLEMGCVVLTEEFFPGGKISEKRWDRAKEAAIRKLKPVCTGLKGFDEAIGTSGTIRCIRRVLTENGWASRGIQKKPLKKLAAYMIKQGHVRKLDLAGLTTRRAPVFAGGVVILQAVFSQLKIEDMRTSAGALREGLIYDMIATNGTGP